MENNWDKSLRILEERKDYTIGYSTYTTTDCFGKFIFGIEVFLHCNKTDITYFDNHCYDAKNVPTSQEEIEKILRKSAKKLIKKMRNE